MSSWADSDDELPSYKELETQVKARREEVASRSSLPSSGQSSAWQRGLWRGVPGVREDRAATKRRNEEKHWEREKWTLVYEPIINALNNTVLNAPIRANSAQLTVYNKIIMINLINTDSILPNLTELHISFVIGIEEGLHITFNVPNDWSIAMLPRDATDIRFNIDNRGAFTVNYRIGRDRYLYPTAEEHPYPKGAPVHLIARYIYNTYIPHAARDTYDVQMIQNMLKEIMLILRKVRENIYSNPQLITLINTSRGGSKTRKRQRKQKKTKKNKKTKGKKSRTRKHR